MVDYREKKLKPPLGFYKIQGSKNGVKTEKENCSVSPKLFGFLFPLSGAAALSLVSFICSRGRNKHISAPDARINAQIPPSCKNNVVIKYRTLDLIFDTQ
jgi:hypothetical protein